MLRQKCGLSRLSSLARRRLARSESFRVAAQGWSRNDWQQQTHAFPLTVSYRRISGGWSSLSKAYQDKQWQQLPPLFLKNKTGAWSFSTTSLTFEDQREVDPGQSLDMHKNNEATIIESTAGNLSDETMLALSPSIGASTTHTDTSSQMESPNTPQYPHHVNTILKSATYMRRIIHEILECLPERLPESMPSLAGRPRRTSSWKDRWQRAFTRYQQEVHNQRQRQNGALASALHDSESPSIRREGENSTTGMALALLRVLPDDVWKGFDALEEEYEEVESVDNHDGAELEITSEEDVVISSVRFSTDVYSRTPSNEVDEIPDDDDDDDDNYDDGQEYGADDIEQLLCLVKDAKRGRIILSTHDYNMILSRLAIAPELPVESIIQSVMETYWQMVELSRVGMKDSRPNATTYELLIHALGRRLSSPKTAMDMIHQMMDSDTVPWTPQTLRAAIQLCQRRNDLPSARRVLQDAIQDESRSFEIPITVLLSFLDMLKLEDAQAEAIELVKLSIEELINDPNGSLDQVLISCIRWPLRDRKGQSTDNVSFLSEILSILEQESSSFTAGFHVWKQFITVCAKHARQHTLRWELVQRALRKLSIDNPRFWPDHVLLKYGLEASEFLLDSELACSLITALIEHEREEHTSALPFNDPFDSDLSDFLSDEVEFSFGITDKTALVDCKDQSSSPGESIGFESWSKPQVGRGFSSEGGITKDRTESAGINAPPTEGESTGRDWSDLLSESTRKTRRVEDYSSEDVSATQKRSETPSPTKSRLVFRDILKAMDICVHCNDMKSGRLILDSVEAFPDSVPAAGRQVLSTMALKGFAVKGNYESSEALLSSMVDKGMKPGEDAYGAVLYSFAVANQPDKARGLLNAMLTGKFNGVKPGAACYNSSILAYVRAGRWQDVLSTYEKMKESEVEADPTTFNGVLLASFQVGGRSRVQALVHDLVASGAKVGEESCELALEILIPELELNDTTGDRRMKIRTLAESEPSMTHFYLNLNRALRTAELEQSRKTTNIISAQDIAKRRDTAWRNVLRHIVDCVKPVDQAD